MKRLTNKLRLIQREEQGCDVIVGHRMFLNITTFNQSPGIVISIYSVFNYNSHKKYILNGLTSVLKELKNKNIVKKHA